MDWGGLRPVLAQTTDSCLQPSSSGVGPQGRSRARREGGRAGTPGPCESPACRQPASPPPRESLSYVGPVSWEPPGRCAQTLVGDPRPAPALRRRECARTEPTHSKQALGVTASPQPGASLVPSVQALRGPARSGARAHRRPGEAACCLHLPVLASFEQPQGHHPEAHTRSCPRSGRQEGRSGPGHRPREKWALRVAGDTEDAGGSLVSPFGRDLETWQPAREAVHKHGSLGLMGGAWGSPDVTLSSRVTSGKPPYFPASVSPPVEGSAAGG